MKDNIFITKKFREQAFALPMVLWTIALLTALIMMALSSVTRWMDENSASEKRFRARQLALSGLAIAMSPNIAPNDPLLIKGSPKSKDGEGFYVEITNDAGLINPNFFLKSEDKALFFQTLFTAWNVSADDQEKAIDGLFDWISPTELRSAHGAKRAEYENLGLAGYPPNAPFVDAKEMAMAIGFTPVMRAKPNWKKYFSTYNPGKIDVRAAPAEILSELLDISLEQAKSWSDLCAGPDGILGTSDDLAFSSMEEAAKFMGLNDGQTLKLKNWFTKGGLVRRIESTGNCYGTRHHITVIINNIFSNTITAWEEE